MRSQAQGETGTFVQKLLGYRGHLEQVVSHHHFTMYRILVDIWRRKGGIRHRHLERFVEKG